MWVNILPVLNRALQDPEGWQSLDITYEKPHVERIWRPYGEGRIFVHRVLPCRGDEALRHPHPWPSWVGILAIEDCGVYEHGVGWSQRGEFRLAAKHYLSVGDHYSMKDPAGWHYVAPSEPVLSIMVTGAPWENAVPFPRPPAQKPLSKDRFEQLVEDAKKALP